MRDSFVLYVGYLENIDILSMEQRGVLITALMKYAAGQDIPKMDGATGMAYSFIKSQMDRDFEKYDEVCKKRSEAGKMGGRPKKISNIEKSKKANGFSEKQKNPDNEYDNEYGNEYGNVKEKNKTYTCAFETLWAAYPRKQEKAKAYGCYKARLADGFPEDELLLAVKRYAEECKVHDTEKRYIKLGSTFLGSNTPFVDYLGDYKPEKPKEKKTGFSNFQERTYDMGDLERAMIQR